MGVGNVTVVKILKTGESQAKFGETQEQMPILITEATKFIAASSGSPSFDEMTALRYELWSTKMSNHKFSSAPELRALSPTAEAFSEHVQYTGHISKQPSEKQHWMQIQQL